MTVAAVKYYQNRHVESIEWCHRAIREAKRGGAKDALADAYKVLDLAQLENGEIEKATHSDEALAIYEELGDLRNQALVLNNLGLIAHDASRWDDSGSLYSRGLAIADRIGDRSLGALMKYNLSEILIDQGRYDEGEPLIREVIRLWRAAGAVGDVAEGQRELARLLARRGDVEGAQPLLESARAYQASTGKQGEVLRTDARIAEMLLIAGKSDEAFVVIDGADHLAATTDGGSVLEPTLARLRGWAYVQSGRAFDDEAQRSFDLALELARTRGEALEEALTLDGIATLRQLLRRSSAEITSWRAALFTQLGIVDAPPFSTTAGKPGRK
jgi:tetratricopeptide (TPR) repeat protein